MTTEQKKWMERVAEYRKSGESQRVWIAKHGIKRSTLRYWLERTEEISYGKEIRFAKIAIGGETECE